MATITAVGTRVTQQNAASTTSTMSINPTAVGNLVVLWAVCPSNTVNASSVTGGNCTWTAIPGATSNGTGREYIKMFWGKATATGAANITVTWSASATGLFPVTTAQQFTSGGGSGTPWAVVASNHLENTASASVTFPGLAASGATQLYAALGSTATSGTGTSAGSTSGGWVWQTDGYSNAVPYNLSVGPGTVTAPSATNNPSTATSNSSAAVFTADAAVTGRPGQFFPFLAHHEPEMDRRPSGLWGPRRRRFVHPRAGLPLAA
jgi:hypothetical protein